MTSGKEPTNGLMGLLLALKYYENIECFGDEIVVDCSAVNAVMVTGRGSRAEKLLGKALTSARLPLARFSDTFFRVTVVDNAGKKAWRASLLQ